MTFKPTPDRSPMLPFDPAEMDRCGLRLTRAEFARLLGCSKQSVGEWVAAGKITLGTDGRLDPRQAVAQLLRNSDPARLRAKVLAPLVREVPALRTRIAELEVKLAAAHEDAEFHEGASMELAGQVNGLHARLAEERTDLATLPAWELLSALTAWLGEAEEAAGDPGLRILDCVPEPGLGAPVETTGGEGGASAELGGVA
jgi:hypothetical protein